VTRLAVTVCELPDQPADVEAAWSRLADHVVGAGTDLLLLPELPFAPWLAGRSSFDQRVWDDAEASHDRWTARLGELGATAVVSTRPLSRGPDRRCRVNQAFVWTAGAGVVLLHAKRRLPEEPGFWERTWTSAGAAPPTVATAAGCVFGTLICSELWFSGVAADLGRAGAALLLAPRATTAPWAERWLVAGRAAALCGGLYVASSNRVDQDESGFGGRGWVLDPAGEMLVATSPRHPAATVEIDTGMADEAKGRYPHYLFDTDRPATTPGSADAGVAIEPG